MSVCIVSFSSRKNGNCGQIAAHLQSLYGDAKLYDFADFFIFNERSQCFFQGHPKRVEAYCRIPKKFIVVSNTNEQNFRDILAYHVEDEPDILFLHARKYGKVSIAGDLMTSGEAVAQLEAFAGESPPAVGISS